MPLIRQIQKLALDPSALTHIERRQTISNRTPVIQIRMDEQHGRVPICDMTRGIPLVVFGLMRPEGAFEVRWKGAVDVGGVEVRHAEDAVVGD